MPLNGVFKALKEGLLLHFFEMHDTIGRVKAFLQRLRALLQRHRLFCIDIGLFYRQQINGMPLNGVFKAFEKGTIERNHSIPYGLWRAL